MGEEGGGRGEKSVQEERTWATRSATGSLEVRVRSAQRGWAEQRRGGRAAPTAWPGHRLETAAEAWREEEAMA